MRWDFIFVWFASKANFRKKGVRHDEMSECLNCGFELNQSHLFCPDCGQKIHYSKLSLWSLLAEFFASLFNLDSSLYRSILYLPIPAYLSKKFMAGKRKRYLNPIRFFLIALIVHIAVLTDIIPLEELNRVNIQQIEKLGKERLHSDFIAKRDTLLAGFDQEMVDSIENVAFARVASASDSIVINGGSQSGTWVTTTMTDRQYKINRADLYDMPKEEFIETYELETYWEKVLATQAMRAVRDTPGAVRFAIGNLIWIIFSVVLLMGLFLKLLYIRRDRYYVEHLILLFNVHTFSFFLASIGWLGFRFFGSDSSLDDIAYLIIILYFFLSIKFYYQQGWIKTFIKFSLIGFVYLGLLILMVGMVSVISFMLF